MKKGSNVTAHNFFSSKYKNFLISLWSFIYILYSILSLEPMMLFLNFSFFLPLFSFRLREEKKFTRETNGTKISFENNQFFSAS